MAGSPPESPRTTPACSASPAYKTTRVTSPPERGLKDARRCENVERRPSRPIALRMLNSVTSPTPAGAAVARHKKQDALSAPGCRSRVSVHRHWIEQNVARHKHQHHSRAAGAAVRNDDEWKLEREPPPPAVPTPSAHTPPQPDSTSHGQGKPVGRRTFRRVLPPAPATTPSAARRGRAVSDASPDHANSGSRHSTPTTQAGQHVGLRTSTSRDVNSAHTPLRFGKRRRSSRPASAKSSRISVVVPLQVAHDHHPQPRPERHVEQQAHQHPRNGMGRTAAADDESVIVEAQIEDPVQVRERIERGQPWEPRSREPVHAEAWRRIRLTAPSRPTLRLRCSTMIDSHSPQTPPETARSPRSQPSR